MRRAADLRWCTPFGSWVDRYTVARLTADLARAGVPLTRGCVYGWLSGAATPRAACIVALGRISNGVVTFESIIEHRAAVRGIRANDATSAR